MCSSQCRPADPPSKSDDGLQAAKEAGQDAELAWLTKELEKQTQKHKELDEIMTSHTRTVYAAARW